MKSLCFLKRYKFKNFNSFPDKQLQKLYLLLAKTRKAQIPLKYILYVQSLEPNLKYCKNPRGYS